MTRVTIAKKLPNEFEATRARLSWSTCRDGPLTLSADRRPRQRLNAHETEQTKTGNAFFVGSSGGSHMLLLADDLRHALTAEIVKSWVG